jgi:hypothetical protein
VTALLALLLLVVVRRKAERDEILIIFGLAAVPTVHAATVLAVLGT